jgi:hypothetical protein
VTSAILSRHVGYIISCSKRGPYVLCFTVLIRLRVFANEFAAGLSNKLSEVRAFASAKLAYEDASPIRVLS